MRQWLRRGAKREFGLRSVAEKSRAEVVPGTAPEPDEQLVLLDEEQSVAAKPKRSRRISGSRAGAPVCPLDSIWKACLVGSIRHPAIDADPPRRRGPGVDR